MKRWLVAGVLLIFVVAGALFFLRDREITVETHIETLNSEFITCLPEELTAQQVEEIAGILARFREMSSQGKVELSDQIVVREDLVKYIHMGAISNRELSTFMAKVSYLTFKSDPNYNLPEGSVDHPLLVPEDD